MDKGGGDSLRDGDEVKMKPSVRRSEMEELNKKPKPRGTTYQLEVV
jgi:hypothetical protein